MLPLYAATIGAFLGWYRARQLKKSLQGVPWAETAYGVLYDAEEEAYVVRGNWPSGVVEFSDGVIFVKVITFPVREDSPPGLVGESMWVILEEGNEFEGVGILDNDPIHSDIKIGSRIKFAGGNTHYKPHFVEVVDDLGAEEDDKYDNWMYNIEPQGIQQWALGYGFSPELHYANADTDAYSLAYNEGHHDGRNNAGYRPAFSSKQDKNTFREAYKMR